MTGSDFRAGSSGNQGFTRFMQEHQAAILADWEQRARRQAPANELSEPVLLDHIPPLLLCIADIAEQIQAGGASELPDDVAEMHAITRLEVGFDLAEVVNEFVLLRGCILRRWESVYAAAAQQEGVRALNQAIDKAILASIRHYMRAQHRTLQALERVSSAALGSSSLDGFLEQLLQAVLVTMPTVDTAAILLLEGELLRVRAAVGLEEELSQGVTLSLGEGFAGRVAAAQQPLLLQGEQIRKQAKSEVLQQRGLQALYGVPLLDGGKLVGVVHVGSLSAHEFSQQDRQLLTTMAARATAAIIQQVLRRAAELRARQQTAIAELQALGLLVDDLQQVMDKAVALVKGVLGTDVACIEQLQTQDALLLRAQFGGDQVIGALRPLEAGGPEELAVTVRQSILVRDYRHERRVRYSEFLRQHGMLSSICVPIEAPSDAREGRPFGVLSTYSRLQHALGQEDAMFLRAMGNVVSAAILRQEAALALREGEERLRLAAMVAKLGTFDWDLESGKIRWSDLVREIFGYAKDIEVSPEHLAARVHPEDRARVLGLLQAAKDPGSGGAYQAEYRVLPAGGGAERWVSAQGQVFFKADGRPYRFIGVAKDITDHKVAELERERLMRELEQAVQVREDILAIVTHDLRSPLAAIKMSAGLLARRLMVNSGSRLQKQLDIIQRASNRMESLISSLLDMTTIQVGQLAIDRELCEVGALVEEAFEFHAPLAAAKGVALEQQVQAAGLEICGDHDRLQQVFSNLLSNAIKFCGPGDTITLQAEQKGDAVRFSVRDTGPGVAPDELPHLFEPYWSARQHAKKGTGLGLFIARGIVAAHGGRIWVESAPGEGSAFYFTVPLVLR